MKLLHIVPSLEPRHGGPSVSVPLLCSALARAGHEVELLSTGAAPDLASTPDCKVRIFERNPLGNICISAGLRDHVRTSDAEIVHSHGLWLRPLHYAHRHAKARGIRHVIAPRGMMSSWAWSHRQWRKRIAGALVHPGALRGADAWHATSESERADIRTLGFSQPVCVAPNGINAPDPSAVARASTYWREHCPDVSRRRTAVFFSRLHPKKRVRELVELWAVTAPAEWLLLIVGIPETHTVAELESLVSRLDAADRIRIFDGTNAPAPYPVASLFVLPSHSENFGLVIAEALAHGVPALVTDTTPWASLNRAGAGWCVAWSDFGATLKHVTSLPAVSLTARGAIGRTWVLENFSWDKTAQLLTQFYQELRHAS